MANELDRFTQTMGDLAAETAVKQIMTLFSSITQMSEDELLVLAQTLKFFERDKNFEKKRFCQEFKNAISDRIYSKSCGPTNITTKQNRILELCDPV